MAVVCSIGSASTLATETPTSCTTTFGVDGYTVSFSVAISNISAGDRVTFVDDASYYATFTYRVTSVALGASTTTVQMVFVSEDSGFWGEVSPCDLMDMMWNQAEAAFDRYYATIYEWNEDLGNTDLYGSGDYPTGECHADSIFDEQVTIIGSSGLGVITLQAHSGSRHEGVAGAGVVIQNGTAGSAGTSALTPIVLGCNNLIVDGLEINCAYATKQANACEINASALTTVYLLRMLIHDVDPDDSVDARAGILIANSTATTVSRYVMNNFVYNIKRSASSTTARKCVGIGQTSTEVTDDKGASLYNNTVRGVTTTNGNGYGYDSSGWGSINNCIALDCTTSCFNSFGATMGSGGYNLSDDLTAGSWSKGQTSANGVTAVNTTVGATDLHLKQPIDTSDPYDISWGIDRGRAYSISNINDDIDDYRRNVNIPYHSISGVIGAGRGWWDIGADESVWSHPYPAESDAVTVNPTVTIIRPSVSITPAVAAFELAAVSPTVTIVRPSVSITPVVAALLLAAVSPSVSIGYGSVTITPAAATFELAAVSPSVIVPVAITPAAASFELAGVSPTAVAGSLSITPSVAAVEFAGVSPSVQRSSLSISPSASAFELAGISPTVSISSASITPAVAAVEFAGIAPTVVLSSFTVTPSASAFEFAAVDPSVGLSSLTVAPAASAVEFVGVSPSTILGGLSMTPSVAALEFAGISPTVTRSSVSVTPAAAITNYQARYAAVIAGGIVVVPVTEAQFVYTAVDPAVGLSSQTIAVTASAFELAGVTPSTINGSITVSPAVSVVEFAASVATIHAGVEVLPAVAAFEYVVGSFTLHVDIASASLGYACDGLVDYRGSIPCDYEITGVLDYIGGVLPTDYQLEKNLDYQYDHQS